jgi:PIN domain nuclease of toxin-antitoxin system
LKLLLDTYAFLLAISDPDSLSASVSSLLVSLQSQRWLSTASLWEMSVQIQIGKLDLPTDPAFFQQHLRKLKCDLLPVEATHSFELFRLPLLHKDPFDRLLIAQPESNK